jgi:hypothetical protein
MKEAGEAKVPEIQEDRSYRRGREPSSGQANIEAKSHRRGVNQEPSLRQRAIVEARAIIEARRRPNQLAAKPLTQRQGDEPDQRAKYLVDVFGGQIWLTNIWSTKIGENIWSTK